MGSDGADIEIEDVEEALLKAEEYAKVMGRSKKDIVADLLDDGKLNHSAGSDKTGKDLLDLAQEKAEKLKTLLTTLIPIAMLLLSVGAEGIGIVNLTSWGMGDDEDWDDDGIRWGCMDDAAINYDPDANEDDEECEYEEDDEDDDELFCQAYLFNEQVSIKEDDTEKDAVLLSADLGIEDESEDSCADLTFDIHWKLFQDGEIKYESSTTESGEAQDPDGADYMFYLFDGVSAGTYQAQVLLDFEGDLIDEKTIGDITVTESAEPRCDIILYEILSYWENNNTTVGVDYDLDCGEDDNDSEGFNVDVQFSYRDNGTTDSYKNTTQGFHFIEGYVGDVHTLTINDIETNKTYDFFWIAIWEDEEGQTHNINRSWMGVKAN